MRPHLVLLCALSAALTACPSTPKITVSGRVLDFTNRPMTDATVVIPGHDAVRTNASGAFSVSDVTAPYSVIVARDNDGGELNATTTDITVLETLSTATPVIFAALNTLGTSPETFSHRLRVTHDANCDGVTRVQHFFVSPQTTGAATDSSCTDSSNVSFSSNGQKEIRGALYTVVTIGSGETTTFQLARTNIVMPPAQQTPLEVNASVFTVPTHRLTIRSSSRTDRFVRLMFAENTTSALPFTSAVNPNGESQHFLPVIPGASVQVRIGNGFRDATRSRIPLTQNILEIEQPAPVTLLEPAQDAIDVSLETQRFEFSSVPKQLNLFRLAPATPDASNPFRSVNIFTTRSEVGLPDLSTLPNLPVFVSRQARAFEWGVIQFAEFESLDEAMRFFEGSSVPGLSTSSFSDSSAFTTRP
jgi:hypothetical protein